MSTTLVTLAADYVSHLLVQGVAPAEAFDHARLRFGVEREAVESEIESRHNFSLTVPTPEVPMGRSHAPLAGGDRCEVCGRSVAYGESFHEDSPGHLKALLARAEG